MRNCLLALLAACSVPGHDAPDGKAAAKPNFWAAISTNRPVSVEGDDETAVGPFMIYFGVVNDGNQIADPEINHSQILVNGKPMKGWPLIILNGPRSLEWSALPPKQNLEFGYALGRHFQSPGTYTLVWKGNNFKSHELVFRVLPKKP